MCQGGCCGAFAMERGGAGGAGGCGGRPVEVVCCGGSFGVAGGGAGGGTGGMFGLGVGGNMLRFPGVQGLVVGAMGDISMSERSGTI